MSVFNVQIVTVTEELFNAEARELHCIGVEGELTILAKHEPFITKLTEGDVRVIDESNNEHTIAIASGVLEVAHSRAIVLCSRSHG